MSHTPGPWIAGWSGDPDYAGKDEAGPINVVSLNRGGVCSCDRIPSGHANTWDIVEANAKLIAAAPDLLDALKTLLSFSCVRYVDDQGPPLEGWQSDELSKAIAAADAAIAKADTGAGGS